LFIGATHGELERAGYPPVLVGTAKRERQKANRQLRLEELAKEQRKEKSKRMALRIGLAVAGFVGIVALIWFFSSDDDTASVTPGSSTTVVGGSTTVDPNAPTTTTPVKPEVSIPQSLPTALGVTTLSPGTGEPSKAGDTISVHYVGVLSADGTEFDNSYDRGEPLSFTLGQGSVIQGWDEGLIGVQAGSRVQLDIPSDLAYGEQGSGDIITPNSPLTFVVDVVSITPAP
jgi:peptidylprolyl isomerase